MNYSPINLTKVGLFLTAASSFALLTGQAAQALDLNLDTSGFTKVGGSGVFNNNAPVNGTINTTSTPNGFGNLFDSPYLLLGADSNQTATNGNNADENTTVISNETFALSSNDYVAFKFDWAFQGNSTQAATDNFILRIVPQGTGAIRTIFQTNAPTEFGVRKGQPVNFAPGSITSGNYKLAIVLNEPALDGFNSAAGFDNISVTAVPFEFSPTQGLLAIGGLWGISAFLKRRKAAAMLNSDL
jgi:hypothetical protein